MNFHSFPISFFLFYQAVYAYIVSINTSSNFQFSGKLYLCNQRGIAQKYDFNSASYLFSLLNFSQDYSSYQIINEANLGFSYPQKGILQSDGVNNCFLYFALVQNSQVIVHSVSFENLSHSFSTPKAIQNMNDQELNLLQQNVEDYSMLQMRRLFFLQNTNIYILDSPFFQIQCIEIDELQGFSIQQISQSVIVYLNKNGLTQNIMLFVLHQDNTLQTWKIDINGFDTILYGNISTFDQVDLLDYDNFIQNWPNQNVQISVFADQIYWIFSASSDKSNLVYKLPYYYSIGRGFYEVPESPKCFNFKSIDIANNSIYTLQCPNYVLVSWDKINVNYGYYQTLVNITKFQIFIQSQTIFSYISVFSQEGNLISLSGIDDGQVSCYSPYFLSFQKKGNRIFQIVCWTSINEQLFSQILVMNSRNLPSSINYVLEYLICIFFGIILIGSSYFLIKKKIKISKIAKEFLEVESQSKSFEMTENQFKDKYEVLDQVLGKGTFGIVKVCVQKPSRIGKVYNKNLVEKKRAIKIINFKINGEIIDQPKGSELDEVIILIQLQKYQNAIRLINYYLDDQQIFIVQELAEFNLDTLISDRLKENKPFSNKEILEFCCQIGILLTNLHNKEAIAHRDIKPQNILVIKNGEYRLSDFGAAKILKIQNFYVQRTSVGSMNWMSPEMFKSCFTEMDYNMQYQLNYYKCDVFSFGLILLKMVNLQDIRGVNKDPLYKNSFLKKMNMRVDMNPFIAEAIEGMIEYEPENRIDMSTFYKLIRKASEYDASSYHSSLKKEVNKQQIEEEIQDKEILLLKKKV